MELLLLLLLFILYFLPVVLCILRRGDLDPEVRKAASRLGVWGRAKYFQRRMPSYGGIVLVNMFLGWTGIGWIAALVWAATARVNYDDWELTTSVEDQPSKILDASGVPYAQPRRPAPVKDHRELVAPTVEDRAKEVRDIIIAVAVLLLFVLIIFAPVLLAAQSQNSIEEELEQYVLSPCFYRIATNIYWRDGYDKEMELNEFFALYESVIDIETLENSIRESTYSLMKFQTTKENRMRVYNEILNLLCPNNH